MLLIALANQKDVGKKGFAVWSLRDMAPFFVDFFAKAATIFVRRKHGEIGTQGKRKAENRSAQPRKSKTKVTV